MSIDLPFWIQGGQWDAEPVKLMFDWMWAGYVVGLTALIVIVMAAIDNLLAWWQS